MATCIILAGGKGQRMPGDKTLMEVSGRKVITIQLELLKGLFEETMIVTNSERLEALSRYESEEVRVVEEPVRGKGPLGGILSGLMMSGTEKNFVLACDMPFIKREAVSLVLSGLEGYLASVPRTPKGLEPLHAAYRKECAGAISRRLETGNLKVTGFLDDVPVNYIEWDRILEMDPTGRTVVNINSPEDMRRAAGLL